MMDWGHGRLGCCDVVAKTNSCACVWGRCFIATQHIEISQINTPFPLPLHSAFFVCVCEREKESVCAHSVLGMICLIASMIYCALLPRAHTRIDLGGGFCTLVTVQRCHYSVGF